jgi:gas vesicle protein GvpA/GvpJ/GvpM family
MTSEHVVQPGAGAAQTYGSGLGGGREPANLGDILERVLDKGLVIAGDIKVNLLDIELLTIKLRLVIASVQTAKELGIDWWENDPWLSTSGSDRQALVEENRELRDRIAALEGDEGDHRSRQITSGQERRRR